MSTPHQAISRRRFLQSIIAAGAAPVFIPASALGRDGRPAPSERITMGCLGFGTIAHSTVRNFLNDERVQVVAIADPAKNLGHYGYQGELRGGREVGAQIVEAHYAAEKESGKFRGCTQFGDFREMLDRADIDAVNLSTPDHWHAYMAVALARKKKHIYGQKPLSLSVAEGRRMVDEVKKAGVTWQTGSQQRSDVYFRQACELVRNSRLGRLQLIKVGLPGGHKNWSGLAEKKEPSPVPEGFDWEMWQGPAPRRDYRPALLPLNWRHNYDYSGGMVTDFGAHHIDIVQWALDMDESGPGKFENIHGELPPKDALYNTAPKFHFECVYPGGQRCVVTDATEKELGITFIGENDRSVSVGRGTIKTNPADLRTREKINPGEIRLYESKQHERNFIDCIYSGQPTVAPIEAAHRTITIAHLANLGLRLGKSGFTWDPKAEQASDEAVNAMLSRPHREPWSLA
ncbi:MAG: Gfo/Idh/MocA family oxidoreductase [Verrucomicrobiales bacterium]